MAYDKEKDVVLLSLGQIEDTDLHAEVRQYEKGQPKLCIFRYVGKEEKRRPVQLFRLTMDQVGPLADFMLGFSETYEVAEPE